MVQLVCSLILGFGIHVSNLLGDHPRPIHSALISLSLPTVVCIVAIWSLPATEIRPMNMGKRARVTRRRRGFRQRIKNTVPAFRREAQVEEALVVPENCCPGDRFAGYCFPEEDFPGGCLGSACPRSCGSCLRSHWPYLRSRCPCLKS
jgi:hypothetical protein